MDVGFTEISLIIPECKVFTASMNRFASSRFSDENSEEMQQKEDEEEELRSCGEIHRCMIASASSILSSIKDSEKLWCECCFSFDDDEEVVDKAKRTISVNFVLSIVFI